MNPRKLLLALGVSCLLVPSANAAFTATWTFTSQAGDQPTTSVSLVDSVSPNIGVSGLTRTGLTGVLAAGTMSASGWSNDPSTGISNNYFSFTITRDALQNFSLTSLSGNYYATSGSQVNFIIRSSVDGYVSNLKSDSVNPDNISVPFTLNFGSEFQNFTGSEINLRITADASFGGTSAGFRDSLVLTGTSTPVPFGPVNATPLPSGLVGVLVGVPMLAFLRRRFHKAA